MVKDIGLKKIQIGNAGIIAKTKEEVKKLIESVGSEAF